MKTLTVALVFGMAAMSAQSQEVVTLKLGHVLTPASHYHAVAEKLAEVALTKSKGTLKIEIFPSGQLGGEVKMIQSARTGILPLVVTGEPPLENTIKEYAVFSLPYLFTSVDSANEALQGPFGKQMLSYMDKYGLTGLGWISVLERNVYGTKKISNVSDMRGLKIRVIQSPGYVKAYEALGAQPTPMAYSEVFMALQTGVVDAGEASPDQLIQDKFVEVTKYYNMTKMHYMPAVLLMSKSVMSNLSSEHQAILRSAADQAVKHGIDVYKAGYQDGLMQLKSAGVSIVEPDLKPFRKVTETIYAPLLESIPDGQKNVNAARAATK